MRTVDTTVDTVAIGMFFSQLTTTSPRLSVLGGIRAYLGSPQSQKVTWAPGIYISSPQRTCMRKGMIKS